MKKIIIILFCTLLCGCKLYDEYEMPKDISIKIKKDSINVYDNKKIKDLIITKDDITILNGNKELNTKEIGKHNITINYKYRKRNYKLKAIYEVKDSISPIFLSAKTNRYTKLNEEINLCESVVMADNYDRKPKCSIDGTYDISKLGTYNLKYKIEDKSGNFDTQGLVLEVVNEYSEGNGDNYTSESTDFSEFLEKYKTKDNELGIDVSAWQGNIDFNKVKNAGCNFVIIRMAYNYQGKLNLDKYFKQNLKKAKEAGLKVGIYVYTTAKSRKEVKKQVKFIVKNLKKQKLDLPIAYDFEDWNNFNNYNINLYELYELYSTFQKELEKYNYKTMLYGSKFYLEEAWLNIENFDIWLAHYTEETNYKGKYDFWQLSNTGRIDGIYGDVDIDIKK